MTDIPAGSPLGELIQRFAPGVSQEAFAQLLQPGAKYQQIGNIGGSSVSLPITSFVQGTDGTVTVQAPTDWIITKLSETGVTSTLTGRTLVFTTTAVASGTVKLRAQSPDNSQAAENTISVSITSGAGGGGPALLPLDARVTFMGDSITSFYGPKSIRDWAMYFAKSAFRSTTTDNFGIAGNSTGQMVARQPNVVPLNPKVEVIFGGTNDVSSQTAQYTIDNLSSMIASARSFGAKVVLVKMLPRSTFTSAENAKRTEINAWIGSQAAPDLKVVDVIGFDVALHTSDGTHPNNIGARLVGSFLGPAIASLFVTDDILASTSGQLIPVASRGMAGTSGTHTASTTPSTGQVADGFNLNNGTSLSVVASKSTLRGRAAQQIDFNGTASADGLIQLTLGLTSLGLTSGDFLEYLADVQTSGLSGVYGISIEARGGQFGYTFGSKTEAFPGDVDGVMRSLPQAYSSNTNTASIILTVAVVAGPVTGSIKLAAPLARKFTPAQLAA